VAIGKEDSFSEHIKPEHCFKPKHLYRCSLNLNGTGKPGIKLENAVERDTLQIYVRNKNKKKFTIFTLKFSFNYRVFDMFRISKCSSSVRHVLAVLWYFFHASIKAVCKYTSY